MARYEEISCKPYKGYDISKSYELSVDGKRIPGSARYMVSDQDDNWIGNVYMTLGEAHDFIDEYEAEKTEVAGSTDILAGYAPVQTADDIKAVLFTWLADQEMLTIDGEPAMDVVERILALSNGDYFVMDVIDLAMDEGVSIVEALTILENRVAGIY